MSGVASPFCFSAFEGTTPASGVAFGALAGGIVVWSLNDVPCEGARHDTQDGCGTLLGIQTAIPRSIKFFYTSKTKKNLL